MARGTRLLVKCLAVTLPMLWAAMPAFSGARRNLPGFSTNVLPANDDDSTGAVGIGFTINFFGTSYSTLYVNNNGNVTFTGPMRTFTPFSLLSTSTPIIAPFFGDVDTEVSGSGLVRYGNDTVGGRNAFGIEWPTVGYFDTAGKYNTFELVLIDRSDTGGGNFDIEFNYDQIRWETGDASGGSGGLGGNSARVGYSNGSTTSFELSGSAVPGSFLDTGTRPLITSSNVGIAGRQLFQARGGSVVTTTTTTAIPVLSLPVVLLLAVGLLASGLLCFYRRPA